MLLSEIFDSLNYGELATIKLGNGNEEGITESEYPALVTHLNRALTALYTEFMLREGTATIQMYDNINTYTLDAKYSVTNGTEPIKYIVDSAGDPFQGKVLKIHKVTTDEPEIDIELNNKNVDDNKVVAISHNAIKVDSPNSLYKLTVSYREGPDKIDHVGLDPSATEIPLPETLIEPLLYFIGARAHIRTPALDGQQTLHQLYMQKYRNAINILKQENVIENDYLVNNNLSRNGWV